MTWSCIHEGGHALYEQGLPIDQYGLPTGSAISLSIHESQSRLWENNVGRSKDYWTYIYPRLQKRFPSQLGKVSLDKFYKSINTIRPNLIRTEADELHYHFHVLIRYEIEKRIMEGSLNAPDLKKEWNKLYKRYLGVKADKDTDGILQDIHWAHGSLGYFPTYSLGSFYAAQFFHTASKEINDLKGLLQKGKTKPLLGWLRENIHQHGRRYEADELCQKITGESLNTKYFIDYANKKYSAVYKLK
jgi:carboxypeptidase Taq